MLIQNGNSFMCYKQHSMLTRNQMQVLQSGIKQCLYIKVHWFRNTIYLKKKKSYLVPSTLLLFEAPKSISFKQIHCKVQGQ